MFVKSPLILPILWDRPRVERTQAYNTGICVFTLSTARAWKTSPQARPGRRLAGNISSNPTMTQAAFWLFAIFCSTLIEISIYALFILRTWCEGQLLAYGLDDQGFDSWKWHDIFLLRDEDEISAFLGHYAAYSGNCIPTFRANLSVPSLRVILLGFLDH